MENKKAIQIVCASNNNFVVLLAVLIKSIEKKNSSGNGIIFNIVDDRILKENKEKLERSIKDSNVTIKWIPLNKETLSQIKLPKDFSTYPQTIYSRLLIDYFIDVSVKKIIYLDSDMMFNTDINHLWNIDLEGNIIGAVQEPNVKTMDCPWSGVKNYAELNIPAKAKYFNSGLLLIDMEKWRREKIPLKVLECVNKNKKYALEPDQYGLNVVLCNKWKELDSGWNHYADIPSAVLPHNIHFVIRKPIYTYYNGLESYRKMFYEHLKDTMWPDFKPIGEIRRKMAKINNILEKVF